MLYTDAIFRFGIFTFDASKSELYKAGTSLRLAPQPAKVLSLLVTQSGQVVTREEMQHRLWGTNTTVEFDAGLNRCIRQLRAVLSDDAGAPRYIETLSRKGYRFIAPVERVHQDSVPLPELVPATINETSPVTSFSSSEPPPAVVHFPNSFRSPRGRWLLWSALIFFLSLFLLWPAFRKLRRDALENPASLNVIPFTSYLGQQYAPVFSPDGQQVAFTWDGERQDNYDIYVKVVGSQKIRRLTADPAIDYSPAFSPDGRWIAFCRGSGIDDVALMIMPALGGTERRLGILHTIVVPSHRVINWSADGKWLVVASSIGSQEGRGLFLLNPQTGDIKHLTDPESGIADMYPAVSPDNHFVAFTRDTGRGVSALYLVPFEPFSATPPRSHPLHLRGFERLYSGTPAWTPDSKQLVFESNRGGLHQLWIVPVDQSSPPRLLNSLSDSALSPAISVTGDLIYVRELLALNIWRTKIERSTDGTRIASLPERIVGSTREEESPSISRDGKKIVFVSNRSGYGEIWASDTDGGNRTQLTWLNNPLTGSPTWSPDGHQIAFDSRAEGTPMIYVMSAEGGPPVKITSGYSRNVLPTWSPDGQWIYFSSDRSGKIEIWRMSPLGESLQQITHHGGFVPHFSPDGRYLFYTQSNQSNSSLWRFECSTGEEKLIVTSIVNREFAPASDGVYYFTILAPGRTTLQYLSSHHGPVSLRTFEKTVRLGVALSPDEYSLYFTQVDQETHDLMLVH